MIIIYMGFLLHDIPFGILDVYSCFAAFVCVLIHNVRKWIEIH